jgi:hypothetical protein
MEETKLKKKPIQNKTKKILKIIQPPEEAQAQAQAQASAAPVSAAPASAAPTKEKGKRCPKGTRKNPKTGNCEKIEIKVPAQEEKGEAAVEQTAQAQQTQAQQTQAQQTQAQQTQAQAKQTQAEQKEEKQAEEATAEEQSENAKKEEKEIREWNEMTKLTTENDEMPFLYPNLNDPNFNIKIAERKEFNDNRYDGQIYDVKVQSDVLCKSDFELAPQQLFVRNFLSVQTPYNSLLLYHGLGSGKTCSAISVAEEMREYHKQMDINNRIIVVASPNVQENFKVQLFDDSKLKLINGLWNISSCTGNNLLKEINPMNMTGLTKENVIAQIKQIINKYYVFMGYTGFANYIIKTSALEISEKMGTKKRNSLIRAKLRKVFNNRLIIIDEVQNIRQTDDNPDKKRVAFELLKLVKNVENLRLLLLSATPMYNSYKEIIWLINLMNINDKRATIDVKDVFDANGNFKIDENGEEVGRELLERKATGYISYVRGENPYTFPYRLWPKDFAPERTFLTGTIPYPRTQLNGKPILQGLERVSVFLVETGEYQQKGYTCFLEKLKEGKTEIAFDTMEAFGYTLLQKPLQALNIIYPSEELDDAAGLEPPAYANINTADLVGEGGLKRIMNYETMPYNKETGGFSYRYNFDYNPSLPYGPIFSPKEIGKYSGKIKNICDSIINSTGIIMVYTQYIDGGIIPVALALEELGFTRGDMPTSLLKARSPPIKKIDAVSFKTEAEHKKMAAEEGAEPFSPAKYVIITGDKGLSPNNADIIKKVNDETNKDGRKIKVILFSMAGSEGLDYKCIRHVHIMDPWYNMSRVEQIIGRAVRTCSHKNLPFEKRNVEIYLYGSLLRGEDRTQKEAVDLYVYRLAELKAVQIGNVSRVLKEVSVDCILNYEQSAFTVENMQQTVELELPSNKKKKIQYAIGDKPFSATCDYSDNCNYKCRPMKDIGDKDVKMDTYNEYFITNNVDKIIQKIKMLMKLRFFYRKADLLVQINLKKIYPLVQINAALDYLVEDKYEYITDKYGRLGNLINIEDLYLFQPLELKNKHISLHDRSTPIDVKRESLIFKLPKNLEEIVIKPGKKGRLVVQAPPLAAALQQAPMIAPEVQEPAPQDAPTLAAPQMQMQVQAPTLAAPQMQVQAPTLAAPQMQMQAPTKNLKKLIKKLELLFTAASKSGETINRGDEDWYKLCSVVIETMVSESITDQDILLDFVVQHIIDELKFEDMLLILSGLDILLAAPSEFTTRLIRLITETIITTTPDNLTGILINNKGTNQLMVKNGTIWSLAQPLDINDFKTEIEKLQSKFLPALEKMNNLVGFMSIFKKDEDYIVFKVKDITNKRNRGARCDQSNKEEALKTLNNIVDESDKYYMKKEKVINRKQVCIIQEMFLRLYNYNQNNNKIWFLSAVEANLVKI